MDANRLARVERLQDLFIRLLFCEQTRNAYADSPGVVLMQHQLPADDAPKLPDVTTERFLAEARGRREGVRREVTRWYARTEDVLRRHAAEPTAGVLRKDFAAFLASDYFLRADRALPHPAGVGPGYESVSKYFFWLRDVYEIRETNADLELRAAIYSDFAVYLMQKIKQPCEPYYERFTGGVFWPTTPGDAAPVQLVSDQLMAITIPDPATAAKLPGIGLQNLDTLEPPASSGEANIR